MAEKRHHAFASPELRWLNNPSGSYHDLCRTNLMLNLLSTAGNQDKGNPALVAHENSSKPSSKGKDTRKRKDLTFCILRATFGIVSVTAVAPIERVQILMQCQSEMIKAGRLSTPYKGMKDCLLRTIKHEGVISLWRGNSVNVITCCAIQAVNFVPIHVTYGNYIQKKMDELPLLMLPFYVMPALLFRHPLHYARVRLASDINVAERLKLSLDSSGRSLRNNIEIRQFSGVFDVYRKTLKLDGIHGLYRGLSVSCIGAVAYHLGIEGYKATSSNERRNQKVPTKLALIVTALIQCSLLPVVYYPFCTVSRRMMMTSGEATKYRGAMDALYQIVKNEGVSSLYKGVTPYLICLTAKASVLLGSVYALYCVLQKEIAK